MVDCDTETSSLAVGFGASILLLILEQALASSSCPSSSTLQLLMATLRKIRGVAPDSTLPLVVDA